MAKKKVESTEVVAEVAHNDVAISSIIVHWRGKSRSYSQAQHGDNFAALAQEFASKVGGTLEGK